jgi:hypothetical protein
LGLTLLNFHLLDTGIYGVSPTLEHLAWWIEVVHELRVRRRNGVVIKVLHDCTVEQRLFDTMYGGVV